MKWVPTSFCLIAVGGSGFLLLMLSSSHVDGFVPSTPSSSFLAKTTATTTTTPASSRNSNSRLRMRSAAAEAAIQAAIEAHQQYGPGSPEARVAWEAVEEIDSSDNRYRT